MGGVPGDARRRDAKPTDVDRARAVEVLRGHYADGLLSTRELDERMARAYAVGSLTELDAVLDGLGGRPQVRAEMLLSHGIGTPAKPRRSFLERQLILTGLFLAFWVVVWAVTGFGTVWLVLILVTSATGFAYRLARGDRKGSTLLGAGSRRSLSR